MRVRLITPPSGFLLDDRVFPALGILKVAAVLEQAGHDVSVLDLSGVEDDASAVIASIETEPADVYGITATMPQMPAAAAMAAQLREQHPQARLLLGGPHATLMQASARQEQKRNAPGRAHRAMAELTARFDTVVCGDGERATVAALADGPVLIDADDPSSPYYLHPDDLESLPFASRHLIDLDSYHYAIDGVRSQSLICQLGCPFPCQFCGGRMSPFLRRVRTRSSSLVIAEMRHLYETYGTRGFMFFDDELNVNRQFLGLLAEMAQAQEDLGVEFRLRGFLKAELITPEMARAMYRAGFRQVLVGFESGSPRILQNIRKNATREQNTRAVDVLHEAGLSVKAAMSIGHPGETPETIEASREWLLQVRPDEFDVSIITVYPGTPYFDQAVESAPGVWTFTDSKSGDRLHYEHVDHLVDVNFYKGTPGEYRSFVWTDALSADQLVSTRDALESDVRSELRIAYPSSVAAVRYEHSMGMGLQ